MEHLTKLLRDSYDLQESKPNESAYWHLQQLRSEIKQLTLTDVSQQRELLMSTLTNRVLTIQNEPDGIVRETMINNLLIDINCG